MNDNEIQQKVAEKLLLAEVEHEVKVLIDKSKKQRDELDNIIQRLQTIEKKLSRGSR